MILGSGKVQGEDAGRLLALGALVAEVRDRLQAAGLAYGHGTADAWDEAAALTLAALNLSPIEPVRADRPVRPAEAEKVRQLCAERIHSRRPLSYLTRRAWFAGMEFITGEAAPVPRSPFAELIAERFRPWLRGAVHSVLDLGTGCGCIGIALAREFQEAAVVCSDVAESALALAALNVAHHGMEQRVRLCRSDVFDGLEPAAFNLIVSNPPYVPASQWAALAPEYRAEPRAALVSGDDGLDIVARILAGASRYLAPAGILAVEVGAGRDRLEALYPGVAFTWPDLARGGEGIFLLERAQLEAAAATLAAEAARRDTHGG